MSKNKKPKNGKKNSLSPSPFLTTKREPGDDSVLLESTGLALPDLAPMDHTVNLPVYSTAVQGNVLQVFLADELDDLQRELETLLSAAGERQLLLHQEIALLEDVSTMKPCKRANASAAPSSEDPKLKKAKGESSSSRNSPMLEAEAAPRPPSPESPSPILAPPPAFRPIKTKSSQLLSSPGSAPPVLYPEREGASSPSSLTHGSPNYNPRTPVTMIKVMSPPPPTPDAASSSSNRPEEQGAPPPSKAAPSLALKYDVPNRFWKYVDLFCSKVTLDDVEYLDRLIAERTNEDHAQLFTIPPLDVHYTLKRGSKTTASGGANGNVRLSEDIPPYGPLTQRLVNSLMLECLENPLEEAARGEERKVVRALSSPAASLLEKQLIKELEEDGLYDDNCEANYVEDEILEDLERCQKELREVTPMNLSQLRKVRERAASQLKRQPVLDELEAVDAQLHDAYKRLTEIRRKKMEPGKKEKQLVQKFLKEREHVIKKLEGFGYSPIFAQDEEGCSSHLDKEEAAESHPTAHENGVGITPPIRVPEAKPVVDV